MRRHLHMSWPEWRALPWYEQRALREGLHAELAAVDDTPAADDDELRALGVTFN